MAKTKAQKVEAVKNGSESLKKSETVVLVDFAGLSANGMNDLRKRVRSIGGSMQVVKKRLLKLVFKSEGMDFDPDKFEGQTGVVFSPKDMAETAGGVYKFSKERKDALKILGGFAIKEKSFMDAATVTAYGKLPSREVLLGQLVGMLISPIRSFLYVLDQKSKQQTVENK